MLLGAGNEVTTCPLGATCKTDLIYQTSVDAEPTMAIYCGSGAAGATWFRDMPTRGLGK
jgi:hypothetical protein